MVRQWRVVRSRTDYILGYDHRIFQNVTVRDLRHNSDHLMVIGCLHRDPPREHSRYLGRRTRLPLRMPVCQMRTQEDNIFAELWRTVPKPDKRAACHNLWMLVETWGLVGERVSARQEPEQDQRRLRLLGCANWAALKEEKRRRTAMVGEDVERLLSRTPPPLPEKHGGGGGGDT